MSHKDERRPERPPAGKIACHTKLPRHFFRALQFRQRHFLHLAVPVAPLDDRPRLVLDALIQQPPLALRGPSNHRPGCRPGLGKLKPAAPIPAQ